IGVPSRPCHQKLFCLVHAAVWIGVCCHLGVVMAQFSGRVSLQSMKRITYARFSRILAPPSTTRSTAAAQLRLSELFDVSERDREVQAALSIDLPLIMTEALRSTRDTVPFKTSSFVPRQGRICF